MDVVVEIMRFWHEKGFINEEERVSLCLHYISEIRDIPLKRLNQVLKESKIEGGNLMPSLAERLRDEGREQG